MTPDLMACADCGFVLATVVSWAGVESYRHGPASPDDHPVVAVPVADIRTNYRCDFCVLVDVGRWTLPVENYELIPGHFNWGDWAACDDCAGFLREGDWQALTSRAHSACVARGGSASREVFVELYAELRTHITGPVRLEVDVRR